MGPISALMVRAIEYRIVLPIGATPQELFTFFFQGIWPTTFYVIIPFLVIAWQYPFRYVLIFALGLALLEVIAPLLFARADVTWAILQFSIQRTVVFTAIGYLVSQLVASQRQQHAALVLANAQLTQYALTQEQLAISRERNRLARDLHDTLAHYMSGLVLELEGTRLLWDADRAQARTTLDNAVSTARTGLTETRRALRALRASPLVDLGLTGAIAELAESMAARNQWQLDLHLLPTAAHVSPLVDEVIYRVVQEGLTNIEHHAAATRVTLTLTRVNDDLILRLTDDGAGFVQEAVDPAERFGLLGMQERAGLVGGRLTVASAVSQGTVVTFTCNGQPNQRDMAR
jgi:signal transduction histidine kinase